jgi:mannose/fructose/N-acetylgalactosamine-specific phosphotransferase system component IID
MVTAVILGIVAVVIALIIGFTTGKDRYTKMSEEEFEAEAKRASVLGAALMGLQKVIEPKRMEYMMQRDKRVEGEQSVAGDPPSTVASPREDAPPEEQP